MKSSILVLLALSSIAVFAEPMLRHVDYQHGDASFELDFGETSVVIHDRRGERRIERKACNEEAIAAYRKRLSRRIAILPRASKRRMPATAEINPFVRARLQADGRAYSILATRSDLGDFDRLGRAILDLSVESSRACRKPPAASKGAR